MRTVHRERIAALNAPRRAPSLTPSLAVTPEPSPADLVSYLVGAYAFAALYAYGVLDGLVLTPRAPAP
ncbi:hypothetical protein [Archangium primigenium]|uniref:hypothetical protein n=1 Tax=[Archangium] primigenium TaxID=2792470 RepID=UPI00195EF8C0|nr:hypothetical protein [Archangium primigenium]MBM7114354.1 hypothetical protein [Archangium primigenium]